MLCNMHYFLFRVINLYVFLLFNIRLKQTSGQSSGRKLPYTANEVGTWATKLGKELYNLAQLATGAEDLIERYKEDNARVERYDPEDVLDKMAERLTNYLEERRTLAEKLKSSLETGTTTYSSPDQTLLSSLNCYDGPALQRLSCMKKQTKEDYRFVDSRSDEWYSREGESTSLSDNETDFDVRGIWNPNFYNLSVDTSRSAVHVPIPIYKYNPVLLEEVYWSGYILDRIFKESRETDFPGASWQFYCSKNGFMRFYPGTLWNMEMVGGRTPIDLYDCRNTEWYINAATNTKNVIILLDMSGSMYGQRYEIAKQTIETILETLSENDFFNIITYSQLPQFIIPCFDRILVQATLRNKRLIRDQFNNASKEPENVANLKTALQLAFETLIGLNISTNWSALRNADKTVDPENEDREQKEEQEKRYFELVEDLIGNRTEKLGCNSAIMLITDGATEYYTDIFETYNEDKKIRFFSFLIGNDVTQRQEVEWMACNNRGYFVHISNLADVQEKVQKYLQVMSRPISKRGYNQTKAVWTGAYLDKMYYNPTLGFHTKMVRLAVPPKGQKLVTTVGYPVIVNHTFKGVVGVSAPLIELQQMAAVYMLGTNAYSFLVDNNGYVMFHPQLRSWYKQKAKPNYNSMDIMELEVLQANTIVIAENRSIVHPKHVDYGHQLRKYMVNGSSSRNIRPKVEMSILYAMEGIEGLRRIYEQTNDYYFRGINETLMTLGLAVPPESIYRVAWTSFEFPLSKIKLQWFEGDNWRLHPDWQYCRPNDSNYMLTKENIFIHYAKIMQKSGLMQEKCANYSFLINRLLFDVRTICHDSSCWVPSDRLLDPRKGAHIIFLTTHTGFTKIIDLNLTDISHSAPPLTATVDVNGTEYITRVPPLEKPYAPFLQRHTRALDENFYRRAMRYPNGEFIFDVNSTNSVYIKKNAELFTNVPDNRTLLITATRSLFLKESHRKMAPIGVVGLEILYHSFAEMVYNATDKLCRPGADLRCYLLDEHGYIIYTSAVDDSSLLAKYYLGKFFGHAPYVPDWQRSSQHLGIPYDKVEALVFNELVKKEFYQNFTYVDFQAMCSNTELHGEAKMSSSRIMTPMFFIARLLKRFVRYLLIIMAEYLILNRSIKPVEGYTSTFRDLHEGGGPCDKWSPFYLLKMTESKHELLFNDDIVCIDESNNRRGVCGILAYAARVPKTNLALVLLRAQPECSQSACLQTQRSKTPLFGLSVVHNVSDKIMSPAKCEKVRFEARYRRSPNVCFPMEESEEDTKGDCSSALTSAPVRIIPVIFICTTSFFLSLIFRDKLLICHACY